MADSLSHAKDAFGRDEPAEALVHLWSALDAARADLNPRDLERVERLAERIAAKGDEAERTEAERLLREIDRARGEDVEEEVSIQVDSFEPVSLPERTTVEPDEVEIEHEENERQKASPLWGLLGLGVFIFFLVRDVIFG